MRHEEARKKIQTTQLINRLQAHAFGELDKPLDMTQIRAIETLLKKAVPDLQSVALTNPDGSAFSSLMEAIQGRSQVRPADYDDDHGHTTH